MTFQPSEEWLVEGLERIASKRGPPNGLEFNGVRFEPGAHPFLTLADRFGKVSDRGPMRDAVLGALSSYRLTPVDAAASEEVVSTLIQLCDAFGSDAATRLILTRLEEGGFDLGGERLAERIALFGAQQPAALRHRFEEALRRQRGSLVWKSSFALPFLRRDFADEPRRWLSAATQRLADLRAEQAEGANPLHEILRPLATQARLRQELVRGIALGDADQDVHVLRMVFEGAHDGFSMHRRNDRHRSVGRSGDRSEQGRPAEYVVIVRLGGEPVEIHSTELLDIRSPPLGRALEVDELDDIERSVAWESCVIAVSQTEDGDRERV